MSYKKFRIWKILVVIFVSVLVGWSIANDNALVPVPAVIAGMVIMQLLKRGVKEETVDERVFSIADKAAMLVFRVFVLLACMASATMLALNRENTDLRQAGFTLAFSVCFLLVVYYLAFIYYNRKYGG
ncbi:DUF2178 domain-containing protein [Chloroflexota bacterium]